MLTKTSDGMEKVSCGLIVLVSRVGMSRYIFHIFFSLCTGEQIATYLEYHYLITYLIVFSKYIGIPI